MRLHLLLPIAVAAWIGGVAPPAHAQEPAPAAADDPQALMRAGDLPGAMAAAERRLQADPDDAVALAIRGRIRLAHPGGGDPATMAALAFDDLARAVDGGVKDVATLLALGYAHRRMAEFARDPGAKRAHRAGAAEAFGQATRAADAAVQARPRDLLALKGRCDVLLAAGDPGDAVRAYLETLLIALPGQTPLPLQQDLDRSLRNAVLKLADTDLPGAVALVRGSPALAKHPPLSRLLFDLYWRQKDWAGAIIRGRTLLAQFADPDLALQCAQAHLEQAKDAPAPEQAIVLRTQAGHLYAEAVRRALVGKHPAHEGLPGLQPGYNLALVLIARGHGDAGRALLHTLHGTLPAGRARARISISIATEHKEAGDVAKAVAAYTQAIADYQLQPLNNNWDGIFLGKAWGDLGIVHAGAMFTAATPAAKQAAYAAAVAAFRNAIAAAPDGDSYSVYGRANLARLLADAGDPAAARTLLREALDKAAVRARPDGSPDPQARRTDTLRLRRFLRALPAK